MGEWSGPGSGEQRVRIRGRDLGVLGIARHVFRIDVMVIAM